MDPNQNDQTTQTPPAPVDDATPQDPIAVPQPEPVADPVPAPANTPEPMPVSTPANDVGIQGQVDEITPPPPMVEEHTQNEQPASSDQGGTGDTNPAV